MREYLDINLKIINKHLNKRIKKISEMNSLSIKAEFKEWSEEPLIEKELIWTLPDLTRIERYKNFCRSIKKRTK